MQPRPLASEELGCWEVEVGRDMQGSGGSGAGAGG